NPVHSISLTGGEPLAQKDFLKEFLPLIKQEGHKTYLETNATLPEGLRDIIDYVDIIALDFKLPSSTGLGRDFWKEHDAFLRIGAGKDIFVKAVICKATDFADIKKAVDLISGFNRNVTFVIQPNSFELDKTLMHKIQEFKKFSLEFLPDVRVIPQMHKMMGVK
ncbi:MAG: radical SAM protein, partial [Candidatus Omnitrophota bacterium]